MLGDDIYHLLNVVLVLVVNAIPFNANAGNVSVNPPGNESIVSLLIQVDKDNTNRGFKTTYGFPGHLEELRKVVFCLK